MTSDLLGEQASGREIPARFLLYPALHNAIPAFMEQAVLELAPTIKDESNRADFLSHLEELKSLDDACAYLQETKQPLQIGDAEETTIIAVMDMNGSGDRFAAIFLYLFQDGSPFMFAEDLDQHTDPFTDFYVVYVAPEHAPFLVNTLQWYAHGKDPALYMEYMARAGKTVRYLLDEESAGLITVLEHCSVDASLTADENYFPYF